jgi:hypothetical protein
MGTFKDFYNNYDQVAPKKDLTDEDKFYEAVGVNIPSLNAFTAWLILNSKIKPYVVDVKTDRPYSLFNMPAHKRILHFVNSLPSIKELATNFTEKWSK